MNRFFTGVASACRTRSVRRSGILLAQLLITALFALLVVTATTAASAQSNGPNILTEKGAALGRLFTDGAIQDLQLSVALGGDEPIAVYVYAKIGGAELRQRNNLGYWIPWNGDTGTELRQRNNLGYWIPWNGDTGSLIDNRFPIRDGVLEFKIMDEDIGADNQGITVVIAYRTATAFKFGGFAILPDGAGR